MALLKKEENWKASGQARKQHFGSEMIARAMAIRCFCPPLICAPRWPHSVSYFAGNVSINPLALDSRQASATCVERSKWTSQATFCQLITADALNRNRANIKTGSNTSEIRQPVPFISQFTTKSHERLGPDLARNGLDSMVSICP